MSGSRESTWDALRSYLPDGSLDEVLGFIHQYHVHLTITRARKSVLGDYRNAHSGKNHRISVNGNLNPYAFLITLLHELAHLLTYEQHGHRVLAHGAEWKDAFSRLLAGFVRKGIFPADIRAALLATIANPAASSCADDRLMKVLRNYDPKREGILILEELEDGQWFVIPGGRVFMKGPRLRKRFRCTEIKTGLTYLFSPVYEIKRYSPN